MTAGEGYESLIMDKVDLVCQRIAPLWPLKNFVAVNPYFGVSNLAFWEAHRTLERISGQGLCMPRAYYEQQIAQGRIAEADLDAALHELGCLSDVAAFKYALAQDSQPPVTPVRLVTDVLGAMDGQDWSGFAVERMSRYCAAYFDEGQAMWPMPWKDGSLYKGWCVFSRVDKSLRMMGVTGMRDAMAAWPDSAPAAIVSALRILEMPIEAMDDYLHAALISISGWAAWARYLRWRAELHGEHDGALRDLLAIRVTFDAMLYQLRYSQTLMANWRECVMSMTRTESPTDVPIDAVLQTAFELRYQRELAETLGDRNKTADTKKVVDVQAVFCIDVRSEVYRRALETTTSKVETRGFAGFFGIPMEFLPFGSSEAKSHLPILFKPSYRIGESLGTTKTNAKALAKHMARRQTWLRVSKAWKSFKTSASSTFGFVEATGLLLGAKLISDSMGWTRVTPPPDRMGLPRWIYDRLKPTLAPGDGGVTGIPEGDRPGTAEVVLRNTGMVQKFGRLILFVGHASSNTNNPQASSLDCGACGGQSGEASARVAAALLNDPRTRQGLEHQGIKIPADTYFMAALHDTTTDEIQLFNRKDVPASHIHDVAQLSDWFKAAAAISRRERASSLGTHSLSPSSIERDMRRSAQDWAQVRPEWGLAGNAAFVAAPRVRTAHCNLKGRVFLHEYDWRQDTQFVALQLIMTAPMIVATWINLQYYGSMVDHRRFGSGNKVLHNVVGGSIGVLEGNGGDLRVGLALQSLHDGNRWRHEPMRLNVLIEAPQFAIDDVITRHAAVRELVDNAWIHLFQIDEDGALVRRGVNQQWRAWPVRADPTG